MGSASWWMHQREWFTSAAGFAAGFNQAASYYYGAGNADNQALRPAVAHLLAGRLPAAWAGPVCQAFAIVAVAIFGWFTRRPYGGSLGPAWLREASALLILATLLAPIVWVQHLVLTIPAIYLIVSGWFGGARFGVGARVAMVAFVLFALVLNREVLGKGRYLVLMDYRIQTLCMILILVVLMAQAPAMAIAAGHKEPRRCGG